MLKGTSSLPLHSSPSGARFSPFTHRKMLSIAAISTLVLLSKTAGAQLLFPVNTQLPFDLTKHSGPGGAGLLWSETRPPRVAIIGAGAAGEWGAGWAEGKAPEG
jgi:hypothetical protein